MAFFDAERPSTNPEPITKPEPVNPELPPQSKKILVKKISSSGEVLAGSND